MIKIEKIEEKHFKELISLFKEFAEFEKQPSKMTNSLKQMNDEKDCINGFVAVNDKNKVVGYAIFFYAYYTWSGKSLYMDDLYVKETYRGQSIGSSLIARVIEFAKQNGCKRLSWQVSEWNEAAIKFYKGLGAMVDTEKYNCDLTIN